jgi:hypothetical protein
LRSGGRRVIKSRLAQAAQQDPCSRKKERGREGRKEEKKEGRREGGNKGKERKGKPCL